MNFQGRFQGFTLYMRILKGEYDRTLNCALVYRKYPISDTYVTFVKM